MSRSWIECASTVQGGRRLPTDGRESRSSTCGARSRSSRGSKCGWRAGGGVWGTDPRRCVARGGATCRYGQRECEGERLRATPPLDRRLPELKVLRQRRCRLQGLRRVIDVLIYAARPPGQARGVRVRGRAIRERVHGSRGAGSRQDDRDRGRRLTQPCPSVT